MTALEVLSHRSLPEHLVVAKELGIAEGDGDETPLALPTRALPSDLLRPGEQFSENVEGLHEIHIRLSTTDFSNSEDTIDPNLSRKLSEKVENVPDGAITVALLEYTGNSLFSLDSARNIIDSLSESYDILISPLMSEQIDGGDLDENRESFDRFVENTETFLDASNLKDRNFDILGSLPVVSWSLVDEEDGLLDALLRYGIDGFCVDFLDKKPTAQSRVERWISPFSERLGQEGKHRDSVLYAVNAYRGRNLSDTPRSPAEDFYVFGLGFDILGRRFYKSRSGWPADDVVRFRCFEIDSFEQRYVPIGDLEAELPADTGLGQDNIMNFVDDREERARLQELLEAEQMAIAYRDLRKAVHGNLGIEFIRSKAGTLGRIEQSMKAAKTAYDEGSSNPSISAY